MLGLDNFLMMEQLFVAQIFSHLDQKGFLILFTAEGGHARNNYWPM
jgi:hypothetical protein